MKYDNNKPPLHLIPPEALMAIATVLGFGAEKYGANDWREDLNKVKMSRNYSSLQRHLNQFWSGEDLDPESNLPHLDHALCQLIFLKIQHLQGNPADIDDRFKHHVIKVVKDLPKSTEEEQMV
jgi:hypothetical protein